MPEICLAAYHNDIEWIKKCIAVGMSVNITDDIYGWTPIIWAIDMVCTSKPGKTEEIVKYLIDNGANIHFSSSGYSDIIDFAMTRSEDFAKYLEVLLKEKDLLVKWWAGGQ